MTHKPVGLGSSFAFTSGVASTSLPFSVQTNVLRVVAAGASAVVAA